MTIKIRLLLPALLVAASTAKAAIVSITATGSAPGNPLLAGSINLFRSIVSNGGVNNGNGGAIPFVDGRREINWDAAVLDAVSVPAAMPNHFFNSTVARGAVVVPTAGGDFVVSGRTGSGSPDNLFSTLNASYPSAFVPFSSSRVAGLVDTNSFDTYFFLPGHSSATSSVNGFGVVFEDVDLPGTVIQAYDITGTLLGSVDVPARNNGLSFAGIYGDAGEQIYRIRVTVGTAGLGANDDPSSGVDMVAMDDFIYGEPQVIPEPSVVLTLAGAAIGLIARRRRA